MTKYAFLPVPTQEMKDFASGLGCGGDKMLRNAFLSGIGKAMDRLGGGCLKGLSPNDVLYVICHGNRNGSNTIGVDRAEADNEAKLAKNPDAKTRPDMKVYYAPALVALLQKEGLPGTFENLHLAICGSATGASNAEGASFAQQVLGAMRLAGYSNVRVTGYFGEVETSGGNIIKRVTDPKDGVNKPFPITDDDKGKRFVTLG